MLTRHFCIAPVNQMAESNYMFSWPDNETLFGKTNKDIVNVVFTDKMRDL